MRTTVRAVIKTNRLPASALNRDKRVVSSTVSSLQRQIIRNPVVLNVEPEDASRSERSKALRSAGYEVMEAECAADALGALAVCTPTAALINVNLPDSTGVELRHTLRSVHPNLPVLLVTAAEFDSLTLEFSAADRHWLRSDTGGEDLVNAVTQAITAPSSTPASSLWIVSDHLGAILDASPAAARLLNVSIRGLRERSMILFFERDRDHWQRTLMRAVLGEHVRQSGMLRPKYRRPLLIGVAIEAASDWTRPALRWNLEPEPATQTGDQHV